MTAATNAPIIIKRKKVVSGDGHHGGAWKVAYADFVTAMMAFFMLMWLLNATTEQQRKGIADYFAPGIPLAKVSGGGSGSMGGNNPAIDTRMEFEGQGSAAFLRGQPVHADGNDPAQVAAMKNLEQVLLGKGGESLVSDQALRHVVTRLSDEGLVIELFDRGSAHLFEADSVTPTALGVELTGVIAQVLQMVPNDVAIAAHTRADPVTRQQDLTWPLSMGRADAYRLMLLDAGLGPDRIARATGHADRKLAVSQPLSRRNNRVEITLLYPQD